MKNIGLWLFLAAVAFLPHSRDESGEGYHPGTATKEGSGGKTADVEKPKSD